MPRFSGSASLALWAAVLAGCGDSSPTGPAPSALVYAALGASDAVGIGAFPLDQGYVFELERRMKGERDPVTLVNLGINGAEADEIMERELPRAIEVGPDVVTVWAGSNDLVAGRSPDAFAADLDRILRDLAAGTDAVVVVGDLVDLTRAPLFRIDPDDDVTRERVEAFNARIAAAAGAHGAVLVRLSEMPLDDSLFSIDGFHPSNEGHEELARRFWAAIEPRI